MNEDLLQRLQQALTGRYAIEKELGRGGMAIVYLARDLKHNREVALKVLPSDLAATLGSDRFLREIQITARLQHPHILPLHDSGAADGLLYYVMPYVEGESLRDRLNREKQLPIRDALHIAREVADGLAYAHDKDVVHRDIKPENIMLAGGHAMIADFGIAQAIQVAGEQTVVASDTVSGTPAYMSPEQATGGDVDARTDIYSLASVLYEMLVGKPPFADVSTQGLMKKILSQPAPSLRADRETVAEPVEQAVLQALAKLPADRFSTVREFAAALGPESDTAHTATVSAAAVSATSVRPAATLPAGSKPIKLGPALGIFLVTSVAVLGVTFLLVKQFGLPDWVFPGAAVLLLLGIPVLITTSVLQGKLHTDTANAQAAVGRPRQGHWLTWRKAVMGGVLALAVWGLVVAGYMASREMGVGPGATLVSAGILEDQDDILIADFDNKTEDEFLGDALKEALSIDLAQSTMLKVVPGNRVVGILRRMEKPADTPLDLELAREVAVRDGIKAVVSGQIHPTGSSYVLTTRLIAAESGEVLTAHRETAKDADDLIEAVDRLSGKIREKIGESLKTIRSDKSLEHVTTASLEALQKYSSALRASDFDDDSEQALSLVEEAIALDPGFAMAHRKMAVLLDNMGRERARSLDAATKAYELRDRLTDRERYLAVAYYHSQLNNPEEAINAYKSLLALDPEDGYALNNIGRNYAGIGDQERALEYSRKCLELLETPSHYGNVLGDLVSLGRFDEGEEVLEEYLQTFPDLPYAYLMGAIAAGAARDYELAQTRVQELSEVAGESMVMRRFSQGTQSAIAGVQGKLRSSEELGLGVAAIEEQAGLRSNSLGTLLGVARQRAIIRGDTESATELVESFLQRFPLESMDPTDRPYFDLAELYALAGDGNRARALLEEYVREVDPRLQPGQEGGYRGALGEVALAEGRYDDAIAEFRKQEERDRGWPKGAGYFLAHAYDLAGEPDSALIVYERFLDVNHLFRLFIDWNTLAGSYFRLAELYEERGESTRAVHYYGKFVELWKDADEELQPRVRAARERLNALVGERPKS